jgi:plasmid maintenance system antidote protein VapI
MNFLREGCLWIPATCCCCCRRLVVGARTKKFTGASVPASHHRLAIARSVARLRWRRSRLPCRRWRQLRQGGFKRAQPRRQRELVVIDQPAQCGDHGGVFFVGQVNLRHDPKLARRLTPANDERHVGSMPRGRSYRPTPPHVILRGFYLQPRGITPKRFAAETGVSLAIIEGRSRFTPKAATKIAEALGASPLFWLTLQKSATPRR